MPYPRAHWVLLLLVPLTLIAFWDSYFSVLGTSSVAHHAHGVTASLWILLLISQSWAIHNRQIAWHRAAGRASFALFPLFLAGGLMVLQVMAARSRSQPFIEIYGAGLGAIDLVTVATFAAVYYLALRNRRNVQLHARYMLATPILLLSPVFSRLIIQYVPWLEIQGPEDFWAFVWAVQIANAIALAVALALYATAPRHGRPFAIAAAAVMIQVAAFQWLGPAEWWRSAFAALSVVPTTLFVVVGLVVGILLVLLAMSRSPNPARRAPVVP